MPSKAHTADPALKKRADQEERKRIYTKTFKKSGMSAADYSELVYGGSKTKTQIMQGKIKGTRSVTEAEKANALLLDFLMREGYSLASYRYDRRGNLTILSKDDYAAEQARSEAESLRLAMTDNDAGKLYLNIRGNPWVVVKANKSMVTLRAGIKGGGREIVVSRERLKHWKPAVIRDGKLTQL